MPCRDRRNNLSTEHIPSKDMSLRRPLTFLRLTATENDGVTLGKDRPNPKFAIAIPRPRTGSALLETLLTPKSLEQLAVSPVQHPDPAVECRNQQGIAVRRAPDARHGVSKDVNGCPAHADIVDASAAIVAATRDRIRRHVHV